MKPVVPYILFFFLPCICSCSSIFEDRGECPCRVILDLSEIPESVTNIYIWRCDENGFYFAPLKIAQKEFSSEYVMDVRRSAKSSLYIWGNIVQSNLAGRYSDTILVSRYMVVTDNLWSDKLHTDTRRDSLMYKVSLKKDYSKISMHLGGSEPLNIDIAMSLHQSLFSYSVTGTPIWGDVTLPISVRTQDDGSLTSVFNLLRGRVDDMLFIEVTTGDGHKYTLPLWLYLSRYGYDADKENLDDVVLWLDPSFNCSSVDISPWRDISGGTLFF